MELTLSHKEKSMLCPFDIMTDNPMKVYLYDLAMFKNGGEPIYPVGNKSWDECITEFKAGMILWYDDAEGSTHAVKETEMCRECFMYKHFCICNNPNN